MASLIVTARLAVLQPCDKCSRMDLDGRPAVQRKPPQERYSIPGLSFARALGSAVRHFINEDGFVLSGYLAFTGIFALFPFLIFLVSLAGFIGQTAAARESISLALEFAPPEVQSALLPAIDQIRNGTTPGLLTFGIVAALWVASSGIEALRHALDRVYGTENDRRNFVVMRLKSIVLTVIAAGGILLTMLVLVAGPFLADLLQWLGRQALFERNLANLARYAVGLVILLVLVVLLHLVLPLAELRRRDVLPGAILTVVVYALMAALYSTYLRHMAGYNLTYGSLGGIVLTLFFFYISAAIFIFGAQLNGALRRRRIRMAQRLAVLTASELERRAEPAGKDKQ